MPLKDPVKYKEYQRAYRAIHKAEAKVYHDDWRKRNPDKVRAASEKQRREHPEVMKAAIKDWRRRNVDKSNAITARRRARLLNAPINDFTAAQWAEVKSWYQHRCVYCSKAKPLTQDHIVPLSKGGSHTLSNIVPACRNCNSRKHNNPSAKFVTLATFNWPRYIPPCKQRSSLPQEQPLTRDS